MNAEILAILTSQTSQSIPQLMLYGIVSRGTNSLSPSDIAAAMAGLSKTAYSLAVVQFAGSSEIGRLIDNIVGEIASGALNRISNTLPITSWKPRKESLVNDMTTLALHEHLDPNVCQQCEGRASAVIGHRLIACEPCLGTGRKRWTHERRAEHMHMPRDTWRKWSKRYQAIQDLIRYHESTIHAHIAHRIGHLSDT